MDIPIPNALNGAPAETDTPLVIALPKGRILKELHPVLSRAGLIPAEDYADEDSRRLRFPTNDPTVRQWMSFACAPLMWRLLWHMAPRRLAFAALMC